MKFLALLSGGKDSCYNIIKCQQHGHELVCLANLAPPDTFVGEEMNSFMYQSAGHAIIPLMTECFGVPLIRRQINGSAVNQKLDYEPSENDEVEDLYLLIKEVKDKFPDIQGVSCGAIVSNYQRFRVENVCNRLGLTQLAYLWQRDRPALLDEMISSGINAILVKVAGAGLEPHKHLGKSLAELHPTLTRLSQRFGLDVCGEGGEYESIVLDCSAFRSRLVVDSAEVVVDEEDASVGNLRITCHCEAKTESNPTLNRTTTLFSQMKICSDALLTADGDSSDSISPVIVRPPVPSRPALVGPLPVLFVGEKGLGQSELIHAQHNVIRSSNADEGGIAVQLQLRDIFSRLTCAMERAGASLADAVFVHLYIASVGLFAAVNEEYCKWFGKQPPSRSCVIVPLPFGHLIALDATFLVGSHKAVCSGQFHKRSVLHVQSVSEWAPLCIGPYCQANTVLDTFIFVAGQIPLDPATMTLLAADSPSSSSFSLTDGDDAKAVQRSLLHAQLTLACRHVSRVLEVQASSLQSALSCTVFVNTSALSGEGGDGDGQAALFEDIRRLVLRLLQTNCNGTGCVSEKVDGERESDAGSDDDQSEDEEEKEIPSARSLLPVAVVGVSGLPRDALVEVEVSALKHGDLPRGALHHLEARGGGTAVLRVDSGSNGGLSVEEEVAAWPVWRGVISPEDNCSSSYTTSSSHMQVTRSLCSGFCHVSTAQDSSVSLYLPVGETVAALVAALRDALLSAQIDPRRHLHSLRVYFRPEDFEESGLQRAFARSLSSLLKIEIDFPVLLVPVSALSGDCLLTVQYMATDFIQLETELWIHKGR